MREVDAVIDGLRILREYDEECHLGARSDMIWGPAVKEKFITEEDLEKLKYGGWFINAEYGNWCKYCL